MPCLQYVNSIILISSECLFHSENRPQAIEVFLSGIPSHVRSEKMERWSLKLPVYEFQIVHRPDICKNMLTLSRVPISLVAALVPLSTSCIFQSQCEHPVLSTVLQKLDISNNKVTQWN